MAKNRFKRTVSDLDAQSIESFLNGGSSYEYDSYSNESYIDPVLGQEAVDILSDADTDHGTALMHTMEALNEANMIAQSIENYIGIRNLKIKMCNAFSKASKAKGYGIEAIDFWRSMEDDPADGTGGTGTSSSSSSSDKKNKSDDTWYKNAWEAIKAFFKKIILAVINFIKTVGNFLKGALCKAQDLFYKKYAKDIKVNHEKYANDGNKDIKIKMKSVGDGKIWLDGKEPWKVLYSVSKDFVGGYQAIHALLMNNGGGSKNVVEKMGEITKQFPKMKEQAGKWFPSAATVVNNLIYGKDKPSKNEIQLTQLFAKGAAVLDILSPAALTQMTFAYKTAQQANKSLTNCLKYADKMSKQTKKFESGETKTKGKAGIDSANEAKRLSQFATTVLIQLYGECLSCRMKVFSAAKKLYKKGDYTDDK